MIAAPPPYALPPLSLRFPALTATAGRAPLGGEREVALACLMAARLAAGALPPNPLPAAARKARANAARLWLAGLAIPASLRDACVKSIDASASDSSDSLRAALSRLADLASNRLDAAALGELRRLARGTS